MGSRAIFCNNLKVCPRPEKRSRTPALYVYTRAPVLIYVVLAAAAQCTFRENSFESEISRGDGTVETMTVRKMKRTKTK